MSDAINIHGGVHDGMRLDVHSGRRVVAVVIITRAEHDGGIDAQLSSRRGEAPDPLDIAVALEGIADDLVRKATR